MKQTAKNPDVPASAALRKHLNAQAQQLDEWRGVENATLEQISALQAERANLQRNATAADAASLAKKTATIHRQIEDARAALEDARQIGDRIEREIADNRRQLLDVETVDQRQQAVLAVANLMPLAAAVDRAAAALFAALGELRTKSAVAHDLVAEALSVLYRDDPIRVIDMRDIVLSRAAADGSEMRAAIAGIIHGVEAASGCDLRTHLTFNEFNRGGGSAARAIRAAVDVVAGRLDVQP